MKIESKLWRVGSEYKVHVRKGLIKRIGKILKEEPATYYYEHTNLVAVDFIVDVDKKDRIKEFIKNIK